MLAERLHLTLQSIAAFEETLPMAVVDAVRSAAGSVRSRSFSVSFDQLTNHRSTDACVLLCASPSKEAMLGLNKQLGRLLRHRGLRPKASSPHLTIFHDPRREEAKCAVGPVHCEVTSFSLIVSHHGRTVHEVIGTWRLD